MFNRKLRKFYYVIGICALLISIPLCNMWKKIWGDNDLGNNLTLLEGDCKEDRVIVYCTGWSFNACDAGIPVVPVYKRQYDEKGNYAEYVETATENKKWVVAKTLIIKGNKANYWIISKKFNPKNIDCKKNNCDSILQCYVIGPLNLAEFRKQIRALNINLKLD